MTTLILIRHGEVDNPQQVYYGRIAGYGLSPRGREQAAAAREALCGVPLDALFVSPQQRAQETAAIVSAAHPQLTPMVEDALNEVYTPFDGTPYPQMEQRRWDLYSGTTDPYEQPAHIVARVLGFTDRVQTAYPSGTVAAVTHGDIIAFLILHLKGLPLEAAIRSALMTHGFPENYPAPASLTIIDLTAGTVVYRRPY